jgi:1-phosphofructokinase
MEPSASGAVAGMGTLVLTVTPNPSLDLLFDADLLVWDDANRMADPRRRPGGQGINVTRAVLALGGRSVAVAVLGGRTGEELRQVLAAEDTPLRAVLTESGETRPFVAVRERASGRSMLLNARGPARTEADAAGLHEAVAHALEELRPRWLACCGSLPAGVPQDFYATLARLAREHGARVVVDCDGEPLRLAARAGCDLLVPNQHEAGRLLGREVRTMDDACAAARELRSHGDGIAAVTLGGDGAALAAPDGCWRAVPPHLPSGSAVGAGDAFLAGLPVAAEHGGFNGDALRQATAAGAAVLLSEGATLLDPGAATSLAGRVRLRQD